MSDHSPWLLTDDAFFHSVILSTAAIQDFLAHQPLSKTALHHLRKTLALLNERLSDGDSFQMDSTIWIILTLAMTAGFFQDFAATGTHIAGLRKVIHLRGGRQFLEERPKMQFKLENLELSSCLSYASKPRLWGPPISWDPIFASLPSKSIAIPPVLASSQPLLFIFDDLRGLTLLIQRQTAKQMRLEGEVFQSAISSIQYRLLFMLADDGIRDTKHECFCLGMLAFLTTMFSITGRRLSYPHLARRLRGCRWPEDQITSAPGNPVLVWLVLISAMTVLDAEEQWLQDLWTRVSTSATDWEAVHCQMQDIAWFPSVHSELGRITFDKLQTTRARQ
jgi:hypothetical protein